MRQVAAAFVLALALGGASAAAATSDPGEVFARAKTALDKKDPATAIVELETLADRGYAHPDVSYNRGLAYALRARSSAAQAGDLGRAAAGFEETLDLRPTDAEARRALDLVRSEIAKRRSRQDKSDTIVRPSLDRVLMRLLTPNTWAGLAVGASVLFAVGLVLRRRASGPAHVAGLVVASLAFVASLALLPLAFGSRWLAERRGAAVIVVPAVTLRDDAGKPTIAPEIPEAARVELGDAKEGDVFVRWGSYEGWVERASVRPLPR